MAPNGDEKAFIVTGRAIAGCLSKCSLGIEGKAGHFVNKKQEGGDREHVRWCKREMRDEVRKRGRRKERRRKPEPRPTESLSKSEGTWSVPGPH